jgi:hypothetical protein
MAGVPRAGPLGSTNLTPQQALGAVASRLSEWFRVTNATGGSLRLATLAEGFPDVTLRLDRDRRLFSRTMQLVVAAETPGTGPAGDAAISMRLGHVRRRFGLEWAPGSPQPSDGTGFIERFEQAGVIEGARTMTNVRALTLTWSVSDGRWRLSLTTLAGALIGTSPGASVAVPLEAEDVDGLLAVLRAFRDGANP